MTRRISLITATAVLALTVSVPTALGKSQPVDQQEPYVVGFDSDQFKRTVDQSQIVEPPAQRGLGNASSDFWNYDARTGQATTNTSPGVAPQDLAALYSPPGEAVAIQELKYRAQGSEPTAERAVRLHSEALNRQYGLGEYASSGLDAYPASTVLINKALENPVSVAGNDEPAPVRVSSSREIEWPQVGIGLGIGALLMISLYFALKATRHRPLAH